MICFLKEYLLLLWPDTGLDTFHKRSFIAFCDGQSSDHILGSIYKFIFPAPSGASMKQDATIFMCVYVAQKWKNLQCVVCLLVKTKGGICISNNKYGLLVFVCLAGKWKMGCTRKACWYAIELPLELIYLYWLTHVFIRNIIYLLFYSLIISDSVFIDCYI